MNGAESLIAAPEEHVSAEEARPAFHRRVWVWLDVQSRQYHLTRFVLLRFTGLVWFIAFLSAAQQFIPLIGHDGLLPADLFVQRALEQHGGDPWALFWKAPSLFWFHCDDATILAVTWTGTVIAFLVMIGFANALMLFVLWALYLSLLPIGQEWLAYGWDMQILETGFLAMLLAPLWDARPFPRRAPPVLIIWLYRWLIFRIMLGAGLIKIRGDAVWSFQELSALVYHYETQPVPGPLSRFFHLMPLWFHKMECLFNHFVELVVPWFAFCGRIPRHVAGVLLLGFQVVLICTGNLSFLNWLTLIPCLACLDDSFWRRVLPRFITARAEKAAQESRRTSLGHWITSVIYAGVVLWLSIAVVKNLFFSQQQSMNDSFDRLHLVNTYGAFGSIDKERYELVFQGTDSERLDLMTDWKDYEFKAKPTDVMRRPVLITPYHYRLDWAAWYPWHKYGGRSAWVPNFLWKLLHNDPATLGLLARNPFPDKPPTHVRVLVYLYKYAPPDDPSGAWWTRERVDTHIPALSLESPQLRAIVEQNGWLREAEKAP